MNTNHAHCDVLGMPRIGKTSKKPVTMRQARQIPELVTLEELREIKKI